MTQLSSLFNKHPRDVGMSYGQHFRFAMNLAGHTFKACIVSIIHAFLPFLFTTTTSRTVFKLNDTLKTRLTGNPSDLVSRTSSTQTPHTEIKSKTAS